MESSDQAGGLASPTYKRHYQPTIVKQHIGPGTEHRIYHFENNYGASVIPEYDYSNDMTLTPIVHPEPLLELAVLKYTGSDPVEDDKNWDLCYDSPVTDDVLRRLTQAEVDSLLDQIAGL